MEDQNKYQGVSNPPNNGDITDIANPEANDATVAQTAAPNEPDQQKPAQPAPVQAPPAASAPGPQSQGADQTKQPDLSKPQGQPFSGPAYNTPETNPAVKKAGIFHDVAEALAGGPRYKYDVDAYGNMTRQKVPVSNAHLALAVAMEALSGAATGYANGQGPNGAAKALGASTAQAEQRVEKQDQQQRQQAQEDFSRKAQVTETNMRMYANARNIGRLDAEDIDKYIVQYKPLVEKLQKEFPGYIKGIVKYSDFGKYNVTSENAIPYARVPRLGPDGNQVNNEKGVPQWDIDYMIVDPKFKSSGMLSDEDLNNFKEMGQPWADSTMIGSTPMAGVMALNKKAQSTQWSTAKTNFGHFFDTLDEATDTQGGIKSTADFTKPGAIQAPDLKDSKYQDLADSAATSIAPQVKSVMAPDNFTAFIRAIINQESSGDPKAVSPTGATGLMQLTQATARQFGVTDRTNPEQNVKAGSQYFAQLLNQYKDPKLAAAAYYSGPGSVKNGNIVDTQLHSAADTNNYAQKLLSSVGAETTTPVSDQQKNARPDLASFTKEHPTMPSAVEKFNASLAHTDGSYGAAVKDMQSKGFQDDSNLIQAFVGGADAIKTHDDYVQTQTEERKAAVQTDAQEKRAANKSAQSAAADADAYNDRQAKIGTLLQADVPKDALNLSDKDLVGNLEHQGVSLPPSVLIDAKAIARYEAPISSVSNKKWYKDHGVTQDEMVSVVRQLNPAFNVRLYDSLGKYTDPGSPTMKTITASAGAVNHLNMLLDLADQIKQRGTGAGQFPILNKLAGELGVNVGDADYKSLQALTQAVNGELGKTLAGGFAPTKEEIEKLMNGMTPDNSLNQITKLGQLYTGILHGKIAPIDEEYSQGTGGIRHMTMIPNSTNALFQRMGYDTPWAPKQESSQAQQPFNPIPGNPNQYKQLSKDKTLGKGEDGKTYVVATGKPQ